jgi:hypothetical protein
VGSSRVIGRAGSSSLHRVNSAYAVSKMTYGTTKHVTSRRTRPGEASNDREKKPEITMNAGMWKAYTKT